MKKQRTKKIFIAICTILILFIFGGCDAADKLGRQVGDKVVKKSIEKSLENEGFDVEFSDLDEIDFGGNYDWSYSYNNLRDIEDKVDIPDWMESGFAQGAGRVDAEDGTTIYMSKFKSTKTLLETRDYWKEELENMDLLSVKVTDTDKSSTLVGSNGEKVIVMIYETSEGKVEVYILTVSE